MDLVSKKKRKIADMIFRDLCIKAGMNKIRAKIWYRMLRMFGGIYSHLYRPAKVHEVDLIGGKNG